MDIFDVRAHEARRRRLRVEAEIETMAAMAVMVVPPVFLGVFLTVVWALR